MGNFLLKFLRLEYTALFQKGIHNRQLAKILFAFVTGQSAVDTVVATVAAVAARSFVAEMTMASSCTGSQSSLSLAPGYDDEWK